MVKTKAITMPTNLNNMVKTKAITMPTNLNNKIVKTFFMDLIFYAALFAIIMTLAVIIKNKIALLTNTVKLDLPTLFSNNADLINQNLNSLTWILAWLVLFAVLGIILVIITYTFFKGLIWLELLDKKLSWKFFRKYLVINLIYLLPAIIILLTVFLKYKSNLLTAIIALPLLHFHLLLSYYLAKTNKLRTSFKKAFTIGFDINKFIITYLIIIVGFIILYFILGKLAYFYSSIKTLIHLIIYVFYFAVSRNYIKNIL